MKLGGQHIFPEHRWRNSLQTNLTFGSFNRPGKLGDPVIDAWSHVLNALPDSRMMLGNVGDATLKENLQQRFGRHGIARDRLDFRPRLPMQEYLSPHHAVDIVLDTWPYAGGTTTNHAIWTSVPVVSLRGPSRTHCQGAAVMGCVFRTNVTAVSGRT